MNAAQGTAARAADQRASFFSTVKSELAGRFDSFGEAKMELFGFHRDTRLQRGN
jgi:hypothetical protein